MSRLPDFEGLAMFSKVAEERSFAAAARVMGVSVAAVSRSMDRKLLQIEGGHAKGSGRPIGFFNATP